MKYIIIILFLFINVNCFKWDGIKHADERVYVRLSDTVKITETSKTPKKFSSREMPQFPGGDIALYQFIASEIRYPLLAKHEGVEGKINVKFVVTKEGDITDIQVVDGIGYGCDQEAIRIVKLFSKWIPGKEDGIPVNVRINIPIVFKLR